MVDFLLSGVSSAPLGAPAPTSHPRSVWWGHFFVVRHTWEGIFRPVRNPGCHCELGRQPRLSSVRSRDSSSLNGRIGSRSFQTRDIVTFRIFPPQGEVGQAILIPVQIVTCVNTFVLVFVLALTLQARASLFLHMAPLQKQGASS